VRAYDAISAVIVKGVVHQRQDLSAQSLVTKKLLTR
jgi:hypothetical protein